MSPMNVHERLDTSPLKRTNLLDITRDPKKCRTYVELELPRRDSPILWLVFGEASLRPEHRDGRRDGRWHLEARFDYGVTDGEHDSIYAVRLPLVGVEFERCDHHLFRFHGWVEPNLDVANRHNGFHVPRPGYDPRKDPKTFKCTEKRCLGDQPSPHLIVPDGFYVPPFDPELYKLVAGKRVEIAMGNAGMFGDKA